MLFKPYFGTVSKPFQCFLSGFTGDSIHAVFMSRGPVKVQFSPSPPIHSQRGLVLLVSPKQSPLESLLVIFEHSN